MSKKRKVYIKPAKDRAQDTEFGPGKEGVLICKKCKAVYFKKAWYHNDYLKKIDKNTPRKETICPTCLMISQGLWKGEVLVENIQPEFKVELKNAIKNFFQESEKRDVLDRPIIIQDQGSKILIRTAENQTAQKLARKIKAIFNKVSLVVSHSEPEGAIRVRVIFEERENKEEKRKKKKK